MIFEKNPNIFIKSVEITSSRSPGLKDIESARELILDYINMATSPYNPRGLPSIDPILILHEFGRNSNVELVPHISPRDGNKLMIISRVVTSLKVGINSFLVLRGDSINPRIGSEPVDEIDTIGLMKYLKENEYLKEISSKFGMDINIGGISNPHRGNEQEVLNAKIAAGCSFFITHSIYDPEVLKHDWIKHRKFKLIAGFIPILKKASLDFYRDLDLNIPDNLLEKMENSADLENLFFNLIVNSIDELKGYIDGIHLMPIGKYKFARKVLEVI
jgi:5,10-methylenetetrahydrofolate reductase